MERDRPIFGVMGGWSVDRPTWELAFRLGELAAAAGAIVLCGGRSGVMEAAAAGAKGGGGRTIGILPMAPGEGQGNPYLDCAIHTGLGDARNYVNVSLSDVVIALAGAAGTLSEIGLALKLGRPVVYLNAWEFLFARPELAREARWCATAEEAVSAACELLAWQPGTPFTRPLRYPEVPEQGAAERQLREFLKP
jgi:uncharacterized protein (TIGR00725 family)